MISLQWPSGVGMGPGPLADPVPLPGSPLIDQVLKEIGIEGGSLAKMGGLMSEASDLQRVGKEAQPPRPKDEGPVPAGAGPDEPKPSGRGGKGKGKE